MSGITILRGPKESLSLEEISDILFDGLLEEEYASKQGLQDYVAEHLIKTFNEAVDFGAQAYGLVAGAGKDVHNTEIIRKCSNPKVLKEEAFKDLSRNLKRWDCPYKDVEISDWKKDNELISLEYVRRVMAKEEPVLFYFFYEAKNKIKNLTGDAHYNLFFSEHNVDKTKAEELTEKYSGILKPRFPNQTSFLPLKKNIPIKKYFELYRKLCDKEPPFPESICARILCISTLQRIVLGNEKKNKLLYNKN